MLLSGGHVEGVEYVDHNFGVLRGVKYVDLDFGVLRCNECVDLNFDVLWDVEYVDLNFGVLWCVDYVELNFGVLREGIQLRRQTVTDLDLQEFDGGGKQSLTWICRNSTAEGKSKLACSNSTEAANSH